MYQLYTFLGADKQNIESLLQGLVISFRKQQATSPQP